MRQRNTNAKEEKKTQIKCAKVIFVELPVVVVVFVAAIIGLVAVHAHMHNTCILQFVQVVSLFIHLSKRLHVHDRAGEV